jgi:hypothetical protein
MRIRPWILLAAIGAAGCGGYSADDEVTFGSAVYTQQAPGTSFAGLKTYYLDPLMEVWEDGTQKLSQPVPASTVTTIDAQMQRYGYAAVTTPPVGNAAPNADLGMRLVFLQSTFTYYVSSGYCSVYWSYYACYPGYAYSGSYSTGTVLMMMLDTRPPSQGGTVPPASNVKWVSALYAVLRGSSLENAPLLNNAIIRAYDQSPYLDTTP